MHPDAGACSEICEEPVFFPTKVPIKVEVILKEGEYVEESVDYTLTTTMNKASTFGRRRG